MPKSGVPSSGEDAHYGVTHNSRALARFLHEVKSVWRTWLSRRSQKGFLSWKAMHWLLKRYPLPSPRIVHRLGT
jgi:hypothetical protein